MTLQSEVNPLFRNLKKDQTVSGCGISSPGCLYKQILAMRNGRLSSEDHAAAFGPLALAFYTTTLPEGGEQRLAKGKKLGTGATQGAAVDSPQLVIGQLGSIAAKEYGLK